MRRWLPADEVIVINHFSQSVFNAQNKRSEAVGAMEVQGDGRLEVDLPIDQLKHNPIQRWNLMGSLAYNLSAVFSYLSKYGLIPG